MRILIVTPLTPPDAGGPSYYSVGLQEALVRAGHTAEVVSFKRVRHLPCGVRHLYFLYHVLLSAIRMDALIILDTVSVAFPAVIAGWVLNKKMVIRTGGDFLWETYVERTHEEIPLSDFYHTTRAYTKKERAVFFLQKYLVFRLVHLVVFSTEWQRNLWRIPYGIRDSHSAVVENAYASRYSVRKVSEKKRKLVFLWVGRECVVKNVETLKEAFTAVTHVRPDVELVLRSGIPQEELFHELAQAYAVVVPSLSEVSPNIVFEAIAVGTPVICTADTGIRDLALPGVVFVNTMRIQEVRDALFTMLDDATYRTHRDALAKYQPSRTYDDVARDIIDIIKNTP